MKITSRPELGRLMTFELSKEKPVHGWFWYKEGYAPEIVEWALRDSRATDAVLDPFCGVGTTLLAAKGMGMRSIGVDASPLAAFASKTKAQDYDAPDLQAVEAFLAKEIRPAEGTDWEFELFSPRAAFPKRNYNEILAIRNAIEHEEGKARDLLLLALLSILPQASIILKDGGVLKIMKDKRALPAKEIFRRKVKRMVRELRETPVSGPEPQVFLGDARALDMEEESAGIVVTSPPYLNNIDYSKIYGLELSLLHMSGSEAAEMRMRAVRSFIGKRMEVGQMPPEVGDIGYRIPIIGTYFSDMERAIMEMFRVLRPGCSAYVVVSNSVIHETHVLVDEILAEIGQRAGFSDVEIAIGAERTADVRPQKVRTRESAVIMRKQA
ncbi:MAG: DNA methyltransferase [Candidatus ainarchaeum sp.]|nr:DNA methyltransferase [Candidatus ainarchaeum sp.]